MDTVKSILQRLEYEDDSLPVLLDGKAYLIKVHPSTLKDVVQASDLIPIFDCFNTTNEEQIAVSSYILETILPLIDSTAVLHILSEKLKKGLDHPQSQVRQLCLRQFQVCCQSTDACRALADRKDVLSRIIDLVGDNDMSVGMMAVKVLSDFGRYGGLPCASRLLEPTSSSLLSKMKEVMSKNDVVRYRVYEISVNIQSVSQEHLDLCIHSNILSKLLEEIMGEDVLLRVTCIAMLSEMSASHHSLQYLKKYGVVNRMIELMTKFESDPVAHLYMPELVKFFGKMCYHEGPAEVISFYPGFLSMLFSMVKDENPVKKKIGIETIGFIAYTEGGKKVLAEQNQLMISTVGLIGELLRSEGNDLRLIAVNALSQLLYVSGKNKTDEIVTLTREWFQSMSASPVDSVVDLCKYPFPSVKCAGMHLIKTMTKLNWGMEALVEHPSFTEYILDRNLDNDKESREARHEAVQALAESPYCSETFGNDALLKFHRFVKEGPYFMEATAAVAIDQV